MKVFIINVVSTFLILIAWSFSNYLFLLKFKKKKLLSLLLAAKELWGKLHSHMFWHLSRTTHIKKDWVHEYCNSIVSNCNFRELPLSKRQLQKLNAELTKEWRLLGLKRIFIYPFSPCFLESHFDSCGSGILPKSRAWIIIFTDP